MGHADTFLGHTIYVEKKKNKDTIRPRENFLFKIVTKDVKRYRDLRDCWNHVKIVYREKIAFIYGMSGIKIG